MKTQLADQLKKERDGKPRDTRHIQALDEGRNEHDRFYLNADGTKSLVRSLQPTSFKDKDGNWQDVDTSLEQDKSSGNWHTKANTWHVNFGDISEEGIQIEKDGHTFAFKPVNGKSVKPSISGEAPNQEVTYRNVWQGIDLKYEVSGAQLKESIIVKSRLTQTAFDFDAIGANLRPNPDKAGSYLLDGAFADFSIASATIETANDSAIDDANISQSANSNNVHVALDSTWLKSQSVGAFPIIIDPTLTYGPAAPADYYNFSSIPSSCHGSVACGGQAMGNQGGSTNWRFAFKSDLTTIPTSPQQFPLAANLHLELKSGTTASQPISVDHSTCQTGMSCYDTSWDTSTGSIGSVGDIDVTNVFIGAMWQGVNQPWFMVHGNEASGSSSYKLFDDTKTTITIIYEALPTQSILDTTKNNPADGGIAVTTQPTFFSTTATDSDGPAPLLYRFIIGTNKNVPAYNPYNLFQSVGGIVRDSGPAASTQWTVSDNVLQDGTTYYWQVSVRDSLANTPERYSPAYSFKVDLRNGKDVTQASDSVGPASIDLANGNLEMGAQSHNITALGGNLGINLSYNSPQVSRQGLIGQYWNDNGSHAFPSTAPLYQRVDPNVDFNWGTGGPYTGVINQDNFLGRWTGYFVAPQNGTYQFGTTSDDGSRIRLTADCTGSPYLDQWGSLPNDLFGGSVVLTAGQIQPICYEYYEAAGAANAQLRVKTIDAPIITSRPIDTAWLQTGVRPVATPHGLVGRYYLDTAGHSFPTQDDPQKLFLARTDTSLTQNWGTGSPVPNGPTTGYMVRWTGSYTPTLTGAYNFKATVSDGVRVTVGSTVVLDAWSDHEPAATVGPTVPVNLTGGTSVPITIDYYQNSGTSQISLLVNKPDSTGAYVPVETTSLSPQAQVLPEGWALGIDADGNLKYDYAVIGLNSVTLRDSTGQTHEYKFINNGFTPPTGEIGHMVRNGDSTVTFQDADGRTYVFNPNGTLASTTTPTDDLHPTALKYTYAGSPARLTQITDGVTSNRWAKIYYAGDTTNCPSLTAGYTAYTDARVVGMICAIATSDGTQSTPVNVLNGNVTRLSYQITTHPDSTTAPNLARIEKPGTDYTDYGYDSLGRVLSVRDRLASDAVYATPQVRLPDGTELTTIQYDALGRVSNATLPAATAGAVRIAHTYNYYTGQTQMHLTGATEPNGFSRKILYDATLRTTNDYDVANLNTQSEWHGSKDLVLSTTTPAGLKSTTLYDYADRPIDQYGPAPSAWFGSDRKPLPGNEPVSGQPYVNLIAHKQTGYDESTVAGNSALKSLAATYYNVDTYTNGTGQPAKALFGTPKLHTTGIGGANGDINKTWAGTPPFTPDAAPGGGTYGWGTRLSGYVHFTAAGNYTFRIQSDDGVRLWLDDTLIIDDWTDGSSRSHGMVAGYTGFNNTADSYHRIRLDYYNKAVGGVLNTDAALTLYMTPPAGGETSALGTLLNPGYGLATTNTVYDSNANVGNRTTTTGYGPNPELGLAQTSIVDPTGLALTTNYTYEAQGAAGSFLRQLTKTLPGGNTTNYAHYAATDPPRDNPCTVPVESYNQAGLQKLITQPDPDGAGPQTPVTTETIYDNTGHVVASRYNTEAWKCTTYDARGRVTQVATPSQPNTPHVTRSARTVTNNWSVGGNPLVTSVADSTGTITTTVDLLGRITSYTDAKSNTTTYGYDIFGRLTSKTTPYGTENYVYDNNNRLTAQKLGTTTLATPSYDAFGRLTGVTYPTVVSSFPVSTMTMAVSRDNLGRVNNYDYTVVDPATFTVKHVIDNIAFSQSSQAVSGTEAGAAKTYTYDKADRLTTATLGTHSFSYSFGAPTACTGTYNANAGKNANRTSQVQDGVTTTYCYDNADRLISNTANGGASVSAHTYDAHGNFATHGIDGSSGGGNTKIEYDSSDRAVYTSDPGTNTTNIRDAQDRLLTMDDFWHSDYGYSDPGDTPDFTRGTAGYVQEAYIRLIGGVLLTNRLGGSGQLDGQNVSMPNLHGDVFAIANGTGLLRQGKYPNYGIFQYTPFGRDLTGVDGSEAPDNAMGTNKFTTVGGFGKLTETGNTSQFVFMGARLYDASLGRFAQVDPIDGGTENNYVYPPDPVNNFDLSGTNAWDTAGTVVGVGALAVCVVASAGACGVALGAATVAGAAIAGMATWQDTHNFWLSAGIGVASGVADRLSGGLWKTSSVFRAGVLRLGAKYQSKVVTNMRAAKLGASYIGGLIVNKAATSTIRGVYDDWWLWSRSRRPDYVGLTMIA
ncbi:MAG TPA: PA14 domain-containing protein [Candidatus Saccharimonadia bacterium]|nr:PA14 domain-containing protein [Candidatus Saccharimonadia bacterium]